MAVKLGGLKILDVANLPTNRIRDHCDGFIIGIAGSVAVGLQVIV